jgi:hypothetical protein
MSPSVSQMYLKRKMYENDDDDDDDDDDDGDEG